MYYHLWRFFSLFFWNFSSLFYPYLLQNIFIFLEMPATAKPRTSTIIYRWTHHPRYATGPILFSAGKQSCIDFGNAANGEASDRIGGARHATNCFYFFLFFASRGEISLRDLSTVQWEVGMGVWGWKAGWTASRVSWKYRQQHVIYRGSKIGLFHILM